jgi:hypothetical protein
VTIIKNRATFFDRNVYLVHVQVMMNVHKPLVPAEYCAYEMVVSQHTVDTSIILYKPSHENKQIRTQGHE